MKTILVAQSNVDVVSAQGGPAVEIRQSFHDAIRTGYSVYDVAGKKIADVPPDRTFSFAAPGSAGYSPGEVIGAVVTPSGTNHFDVTDTFPPRTKRG
jgi:hypothetical protein